jgi:acetyl esterase/lipase
MGRRRTLAGVMALLLSACKPATLLNAVIPTRQLQRFDNIAYGNTPRQRLDIYRPLVMPTAALPVVVFFYGGSWDSGNKEDYLFVAEALTSHGYVVVIADYRIYPEVKFPGLMEDPARVFAWVKQHIAEYQGNPDKVFLMGHSAGAQLATMLALNADYLAAVHLQRAQVAGVIGLAGPYDFLPLTSARLKAIFAPADLEWTSQPIRFVDGHNPPMLLLVGLRDRVVWPRNTFNLASAIKAHGGPVQVLDYAGYDHVDMVAKLAKPLRGQSTLLTDIVQWMQQHG